MLLCCYVETKNEHTFRCDLSNQMIEKVTDKERPCPMIKRNTNGSTETRFSSESVAAPFLTTPSKHAHSALIAR